MRLYESHPFTVPAASTSQGQPGGSTRVNVFLGIMWSHSALEVKLLLWGGQSQDFSLIVLLHAVPYSRLNKEEEVESPPALAVLLRGELNIVCWV